MKAALTSINPPHTNNIFERLKRIEWRTKPMPTGKHYCYETKKCFGIGKVIGEFRIWRIKRYENISLIPEDYIFQGCVPIEFLEAYSKGRPLYAHFIINPKRYDKPRELSEFVVEGDCLNGDCKKCKWFDGGNNYNVEADCLLPYDFHFNKTVKPLFRPPRSWCYVESEVDTE